MVAEDEAGTLAAFRAHLNAIEPVVLNHGGRIVKTTGDGLHAEFPIAASAVNAAISSCATSWKGGTTRYLNHVECSSVPA